MIEVHPVNNRRMLRQFIDFPYTKYRAHPHWTPQLRLSEWHQFDPTRNPFFATADIQLFLAVDSNRVSGRIAAIDDRRHNEVHRDNVGMFRSEKHTSELQSRFGISYAVFCLKKKK